MLRRALRFSRKHVRQFSTEIENKAGSLKVKIKNPGAIIGGTMIIGGTAYIATQFSKHEQSHSSTQSSTSIKYYPIKPQELNSFQNAALTETMQYGVTEKDLLSLPEIDCELAKNAFVSIIQREGCRVALAQMKGLRSASHYQTIAAILNGMCKGYLRDDLFHCLAYDGAPDKFADFLDSHSGNERFIEGDAEDAEKIKYAIENLEFSQFKYLKNIKYFSSTHKNVIECLRNYAELPTSTVLQTISSMSKVNHLSLITDFYDKYPRVHSKINVNQLSPDEQFIYKKLSWIVNQSKNEYAFKRFINLDESEKNIFWSMFWELKADEKYDITISQTIKMRPWSYAHETMIKLLLDKQLNTPMQSKSPDNSEQSYQLRM